MADHRTDRANNDIGDHWVDVLIAQYDGANNRRSQNFTFFWQAAALGLTAQAFLFNVALSNSTSNVGRYIAASLSLGASVATLVLMRTQKVYQHVEGAWLDTLEVLFHWPVKMLHDAKAPARAKRLNDHLDCVQCSLKCRKRGKKDPGDQAVTKEQIQGLKVKSTEVRFNLFWDATLWWLLLNWTFVAGAVAVILITQLDPQLLH